MVFVYHLTILAKDVHGHVGFGREIKEGINMQLFQSLGFI